MTQMTGKCLLSPEILSNLKVDILYPEVFKIIFINFSRHKNRVSGRRRNQNRGKSDPVPSKPPYTVSNHHRGLVPQLWENYTKPSEAPAENVSCNTARFKCAQRPGCKMALTSYAMHCNVLVAEDGDRKGKRPFAGKQQAKQDLLISIIQIGT